MPPFQTLPFLVTCLWDALHQKELTSKYKRLEKVSGGEHSEILACLPAPVGPSDLILWDPQRITVPSCQHGGHAPEKYPRAQTEIHKIKTLEEVGD